MQRYNPKEIEPKWQKQWATDKLYETDTSKLGKKFYIIPMFPYPSGDLHVGHWYNFAPTDTIARWHRMRGYNVLHCNGFDAFGLPAENAAIKRNIPPAQWTSQNIESMTKQLQAIGASYDWDKKVVTSDPDYYKWTQWLFLKLHEKGLAYRKKGLVNWCPKDKTVLANEQTVGEDGTENVCVRCGTPIEQKELKQWYFKITDYADRLLEDAEGLDWPERVKTMQENWIGKSKGAHIKFQIDGSSESIEVFTTRPDTLFGATYMVLAPEHSLVGKVTAKSQKAAVEEYIKQAENKTELARKEGEKDKTGVPTGAYAINPVNNQKISIWIADYVLMGYGTGAIMAVPAHDLRDFEFASKYELPVVTVVQPKNKKQDECYAGEGKIVNSEEYNGLDSSSAREKIVADLSKRKVATERINYKLRDWLISRQRYWGAPIPIIHCDGCGIVPVPEKDLPVLLPEDVEFTPTGQSPLVARDDFVNVSCPKCGKDAKRETDTMDTFVDSSWYFLRYPDTDYEKGPYNPGVIAKWGPLDHYIGGIEHAILHLLYARFITKFLHDHNELPFDEPFKKLSNQGIILGPDGDKMSKSKGNVVSPDEQLGSYGADSLRLYLMFMGPYDQGGPYSFGGIAGVRRFLDRLWTLSSEYLDSSSNANTDESIEKTASVAIKKVSQDLEGMSFNTAIAAMMAAVNELYKIKAKDGFKAGESWQFALSVITRLLAPFAPHIAEELWHELGQTGSVHISNWPVHEDKYLQSDTITVVVQVNGKVRANISVSAEASEETIVKTAKSDTKVAEHLKNKQVRKTVYVPQRLINFVV
jgi:leucyl-tRNA synthetase